MSDRSASASGAYATTPSPTSRQPPASASAPCPRTRPVSSVTSRVLPTPASPATTTVAGEPARARSKAAQSWAASAARPTSTGLETRRATPPIIAEPCLLTLTTRPGRSGGGRPGAPQAEAGPAGPHPAVAGASGAGCPELAGQALPGGLLVPFSDALGGDLAGDGGVHLVLPGDVP